jgi:predicted phosphate transport protein (TIGR00153 family)
MRSIFGIIAKSPFAMMAQHTERVHDTVVVMRPLMEAFMDGEWDRVDELYARISKLEHKADVIKHDIRDHLPRSLFLPVDRADLLLFLREQDAIADKVEDLADILTMRRTATPVAMRDPILDLVDRVTRTSETWYEAAAELTILQEASFGGAGANRVLKLVNEVGELEWEADKVEAAVLKTLFRHEEELGAVSVLFWMNIISTIGGIADHAENTADFLRLMLARA